MRLMNKIVGSVALAGLALGGCVADVGSEADLSDSPDHEGARAVGTGPQYARFAGFAESGRDQYGVKGYLPPNSELSDVYADMTESQRKGLATWHLFAGERGDFFSTSQQVTWNGQNMLRVADDRKRSTRFETTGMLNDPDCTPATGPDQFGVWLANCPKDPYSSGIVGLRLRPNPEFDLAAWKRLGNGDVNKAAEKWLRVPKDRFEWKSDQLAEDIKVQPPYELSMACTICHATVNPLDPPANPNAPTWKNIVFGLGNQYFQEGTVFGDGIPSDDFLRQVLDAQHPGTSDTSRMATDHIHNPNTINSLFNLPYRPLHKERVKQFDANGEPVDNYDIKYDTCDGETCEVDTFRVLKDGADSSGVSGAALRVFINIGSCYSEFKANMDPVWGVKHPTAEGRIETPISRKKLADECRDYQQLMGLAPYLIDYLTFIKPYRLAAARGGAQHVKDWNDPQMKLGRQVFAEECATCHSSIQPEFPDRNPDRADALFEREFAGWTLAQQKAWLKDPTRVQFFKDRVEDPAFFEQNYLADDRRWPLPLIGAQSGRALGTNAAPGNVWEEYASVDYQTLPPVDVPVFKFELGTLKYVKTVKSKPGVGYLRTPSLWGIWTSAPFLHNNSLGSYDRGITVEARLRNYNDAMEKLLGLQARQNVLRKTDRWTFLTTIPLGFRLPDILPGIDLTKLRLGLPIPPGLPVASAANLELSVLNVTSLRLADVLRIILDGPNFWQERMQDFITVFDPIEDKGHEFGSQRTVEEKRALIEFLKTL